MHYITHIDNIASMLSQGIFSHQQVIDNNIPYTPIYDEEIVSRRKDILAPDGTPIWTFVNFYFQPRNPMLYRVTMKNSENIAILGVDKKILKDPGVFVSTGNAASDESVILKAEDGLPLVESKIIKKEYWSPEDGSKRKIMAECLVKDSVPSEYIRNIYVKTKESVEQIKTLIGTRDIQVVADPFMFFTSDVKGHFGNITLVEGDLFYSKLQTLTVSVNTKGVMGKGLASRAKYQFPDVYVYYQDLCRKQNLMGTPALYKREASFDIALADDPQTLQNANGNTWFLLFATKADWRNDADIKGIEKGLIWLKNNYEKEEIKSLAIPALGCGLGNLEWRNVGPLMCKYLSTMKIPVHIYLPAEKNIDKGELTSEFLLKLK